MREISLFSRFGTLCLALLLLGANRGELRAQPAPRTTPVKTAGPEELSQAELLESYLNLREQLHSAQLAIVNNRLETEAAARAQAAAITEKFDALKSAMAAERLRLQEEADKAEYERAHQLAEAQRANRTIVWIASAFGGVGLLAMLFTALFQWRAINRMAEVVDLRLQLPAPPQQNLLPSEANELSGQTVALSNQRMLSAIDRIEQRIHELEHTAVQPAPPGASADPIRQVEGLMV
jgi:hypothetical protein